MKDLLRTSLLFGMGVYAKGEREIKHAVRELVRSKRLSKKEGEKLVAQSMVHAKRLRKKLEVHARTASLELYQRLRAETRKELGALEKRLKRAAKKALKK